MSDRTVFHIQMYVVRVGSQVSPPIIPPNNILFILQAQPVTELPKSVIQTQRICQENQRGAIFYNVLELPEWADSIMLPSAHAA